MGSAPAGKTIRLAAGILLTSLAAALAVACEAVRSAAFSAVGRGLSPGEASVTYRLFSNYVYIHGVCMGFALLSLLALHRWAVPGHWAPVSAACGTRIGRASRLAVAICLVLAVFSTACGRFAPLQWSYAAANYAVALVLIARLWLSVAVVIPFPRDRFAAVMHKAEVNPFIFCGFYHINS